MTLGGIEIRDGELYGTESSYSLLENVKHEIVAEVVEGGEK